MSEVKRSKTVIKRAELRFSREEVEDAVRAAIGRDHRELKDYRFDLAWQSDGGIVATGTLTTGGEEADNG